jgi:hypothetical protein
VERNHARSFDHRSFYFRQQDKKYMSTKQLVSEITAFSQPSTAAVSMPVSTAAPLTAAAATSAAVNISPTDATAVFEVRDCQYYSVGPNSLCIRCTFVRYSVHYVDG